MKCKQTIIVAAPLGSGTSRVAMLLKQQGIFMGSHPNTSHEDLDFALPFFNKSMLQAIAKRNEMYEIWGWKFTFMRNWFEQVFPALQNPCFVYCNRSHRERCLSKPEKYDFPAIEEDYLAETLFWRDFFARHKEVPIIEVDFSLSNEEVMGKIRTLSPPFCF